MTNDDNESTMEGDNAQDGAGRSLAKTEDQTDETENPICPHCMEMLGPHDHMCPHCGAPLDMNASIGFERTLTEGWLWRAAANRPIPLIVMLGAWLVMIPIIINGSLFMFVIWGGGGTMLGIVSLGVVALYAAVLMKITRNYFRQKAAATSLEKNCGGNADSSPG